MNDGYGFLLLTSHLGNPERKPLTIPQLRVLTQRVHHGKNLNHDGELTQKDLISLGYDRDNAARIISLLSEQTLLEHYLQIGKHRGCIPITRQNPGYPLTVRKRLGLDSPGCLWIKGDAQILKSPAVALVGSRTLSSENQKFAEEAGRQAAIQGLTLVSGNAKGADSIAQESCLEAGGQVISVLADALHSRAERQNVLYVSEEDYDESFSSFRALRRNRVIHAMGWVTIVAQSTLGKGGTWSGTVQNLRSGWTPVFCFRDGSEAASELEQMGASLIGMDALGDFAALSEQRYDLFSQ